MKRLKTYKVIWEIDIEATNKKKAARCARKIQLDPNNVATCFSVSSNKPNSTWKEIDLSA